jgi:F-type H+-transporting ATPase subunit delta
MSSTIAKRYVKALCKDQDSSGVTNISESINFISSAFCNEKFKSIVSSTDVSKGKKVELILSFVESKDDKLTNFIKLLADNKRLDIIPDIANELKQEIATLTNTYSGIVYTNKELNQTDLVAIQEKFAAKFNVTLALTQNVCDYDGIKVDIDGLGVEIGFSKDRLKSQMIEHILKAV